MNLKITKNIEEANLITHASKFHPDDVFSTIFLAKIIKNPIVARVNKVEGINKEAIVYDIGLGMFDHHGQNALMRNEKIKYSSFGLLWKHFGKQYLDTLECDNKEQLFKNIEENLIMQIDGIDNGCFPKIIANYPLTDLDKIIDLFNSCWDEEIEEEKCFLEACLLADKIFDRFIKKEIAHIKAMYIVEEEIDKEKEGILILNEYMPYEEAIFTSKKEKAKNIKVVITPSNRGGFNIKPMPISKEEKALIVNFPQDVRGLQNEELAKKIGIPTARFIHSSGFLACADTINDAIALAKLALQNKE